MTPKKRAAAEAGGGVASIAYDAKRKNIPPAGLEAHGQVREKPAVRYEYNPHLPPVLRSSPDPRGDDSLPELLATALERALTPDEAVLLVEALRRHEPWLEWSGKREKPWFEVDPVALHMHERVSTQAILRVVARQDPQRDLFADPQLDYARAVQFYQHDVDWSNRMILGDSLAVMASLARREDLAGKVQMIYLDPPYGIRFSSNFQPQLGQRDVKDKQQDLTREPEMVKAYRDTWTLGIHSYLAYLRDRLTMARELLTDTGSIFVQISDENLHRVRCVMDEVFGPDNFCRVITIRKTAGDTTTLLTSQADYVLWYAKDAKRVKYRPLFVEKNIGTGLGEQYDRVFDPVTGSNRRLTSEEADDPERIPFGWQVFRTADLRRQGYSKTATIDIEFEGRNFFPGQTRQWKTNAEGLSKLKRSERLHLVGDTLEYRRYYDDWRVSDLTNMWMDAGGSGFADPKLYVVQTVTRVIERCMLMTTDPGDLVLDPTCGSGTTAYVAERRGRRWITIDTSRVALALAKHRLLTAKFDYYQLRDLEAEDIARNPDGTWIAETDGDGKPTGKRVTFDCRTVPHIKLQSIARNTSLDPIFARHEPILDDALAALNQAVETVDPARSRKLVEKLIAKHRQDGARAVTDADIRRWLLPGADPAWVMPVPARKPFRAITPKQAAGYQKRIPADAWRAWEAPFDTDPDWPADLQAALTAYRAAWRAKMNEVNACIAKNAETEELVDRPKTVSGTVRVAGPFSVEGVIAREEGPDSPIGGVPDELDAGEAGDVEVADAEAHLDKIIRLLKASGVDFSDNKNVKLSRLEAVTGANFIHAEGEWLNGNGAEQRVAVSIGPEVGTVTAMQVENAVRDANRKGYDDVVFAGFGFDAAAQEAIDAASHPSLRLHMALISPDVAMGELLKDQPGSQLFRVFSAPRVSGPTRRDDGTYVVEVEGMDVFDPVSNSLYPTARDRIAAWFLDTDYDGRTFCICQAFFPDKTKWDKLAKALGNQGTVEPAAFEALSGFQSLPFTRPARLRDDDPWKVAVKVIDPRGNEGLRVLPEGGRWT